MKKLLLLAIVLFCLGIGFYFISSAQKKDPLIDTPTPQPLPTSFKIDVSDLEQGGASYGDPNGIFSFLYPLGYKQDLQNDGKHVRIYKIGDTQQGQTEIYDGVVIVFEAVTLGNQSLESWVDTTIKNATADGTSEVLEPKKQIAINGYPGYTYRLRGLGESQSIVLQKDPSSEYAVLITTMVADPQNVGFQKDVDKILATLEIFR